MTRTIAPPGFASGFGFFTKLLLVFIPNVMVYSLQLAESNAYLGYESIHFGLAYWARAAAAIALLAALMPRHVRKPSDFFLLLYGVFTPLNYVMFHSVEGEVTSFDFVIRFLILLAPMAVVRLGRRLTFQTRPFQLMQYRTAEFGIATVSLLIGLVVLSKGSSSAGFGLNDVYERRLDGRDIFSAGSPIAYASTMVVNGFTPFLAFMAGVNPRKWLFAFALGLATVFFYVIGLKSPLAFTGLAYAVGFGVRKGPGNGIYKALAWALGLAFVAFLIEMQVNQFSWVAEFFFRRVFVVPADVIQNYFHLILVNTSAQWSAWVGIESPHGVTFLIGSLYYGNDLANVNTNAFLDALAAHGIPGLLAALGLICAVMTWLDGMHRSTRNPAFIYIGFIYSLLLTEQAASTALVSSGIGMLMLILALSTARHRPAIPLAPPVPSAPQPPVAPSSEPHHG